MTLKTIRTYTGDGATTIYSIDFQLGYINKDYVYVYLDTDTYATQLDYVWLNAAQIEITTAVANGVSFNIRRVVPRDRIVNDYTDGAILRELNLDNSYKQALMWLEEVEDGFITTGEDWYLQSNLNMLQNHITNLPAPVDVTSPVRLQELQDLVIAGGGVSVHNALTGRDAVDSHPITAVTGLTEAIALKADASTLTAHVDGVDSHPMGAITGLTEIIEELQMAASSADITAQPDYPYKWNFPVSATQNDEMLRKAANNSIGSGGSTWWVRPSTVGREEDGVDTVYIGSTFGSPENRSMDTAGLDAVLANNKSKGEAIIAVTKVSIDSAGVASYSKKGINDTNISYREDEHHQPMTLLNPINGQLITSWGSRNSARNQDGTGGVSNKIHVRYGQSLDSLSVSEAPESVSTNDYSQGVFVGNSSFIFARDDVGNWGFTQGAGGQNYSNFTQLLSSTDQYYLGISDYDSKAAGYNVAEAGFRPLMHIFGQGHPTITPDRQLRYLKGEFFVAGSTSGIRDSGGVFLEKPTTETTPVGDGKLGSNLLTKDLFETAYTAAAGNTYRLLDVQYGQSPRALIVEFTLDWVHGASIPFGTTFDLKLISFHPITKTWSALTLKTGLRCCLGYKPEAAAYDVSAQPLNPPVSGVEGYTSGYVHGASFWRGKNGLDVRPIVYFADRDGDNQNRHRLTQLTLADDYSAVAAETVLLDNSKNILYRPEMTIGGNKRFLWYNEAQGWSSFNSYVAEHRWLDLTPVTPEGVPVFSVQPVNTTVADGANTTIGLEAVSYGGSKLTYVWWFKNSGGVFAPASATTPFFVLTGSAAANAREYYCVATNDVGSTQSATITITVT